MNPKISKDLQEIKDQFSNLDLHRHFEHRTYKKTFNYKNILRSSVPQFLLFVECLKCGDKKRRIKC